MPEKTPVRQLSKTASRKKVRELIAQKKALASTDLRPGNILFTAYNAKDKSLPFDRTPLFLILRSSKSYVLGLNFHWIPYTMRVWLVQYIIRQNKQNIRHERKLDFSYRKLKGLLKKLKYSPCIRLYIVQRLGPKGTVIDPKDLKDVCTLDTSTFTGVDASTIYKWIVGNKYKPKSKSKKPR